MTDEREITAMLQTLSDTIVDLILEHGVPVPKIESWTDDAIETAEALALQKEGRTRRPARSVISRQETPRSGGAPRG